MSLPINEIVTGDCIEVLRKFPDCCIDEVVTDPPYGIGFMGKNWDKALPSKEAFEQIFRVLKSGGLAFVMSSPRQDVLWRMLSMLEDVGFELKQSFVSWIYKSGFPKAYDVSKGIDKKFGVDKKRKKGQRYIAPDGCKRKAEDHSPNELIRNPSTHYGYKESGYRVDTLPESELAKKWDGWKSITGLKPALECVLMVNKPMSEKTIVDNVLVHGVGAVNVDDCRIPFQNIDEMGDWNRFKGFQSKDTIRKNMVDEKHEFDNRVDNGINQHGRFPANLLVSDGALDNGKITKSPNSYKRKANGFNVSCYGKGMGESEGKVSENYGDVGGQSRFFDLDAWAKHHGFLDVAKASKSERNMGCGKLKEVTRTGLPLHDGSGDYVVNEGGDGTKSVRRTKARNVHPTVKPIKLMAYLIELGCPEGGVVLDPFCGSGSTLIAAHRLNRKWIGIEVNSEYAEIIRHRLSVLNQKLTDFMRVGGNKSK